MGGRPSKAAAAVLLLVTLVAPGALADRVDLVTAEPVRIAGDWTAVATEGSLTAAVLAPGRTAILANATGVLALWTWTRADSPPLAETVGNAQAGDATAREFRVENATVLLRLDARPLRYAAATHGAGEMRVAARLDETGAPVRLAQPLDMRPGPAGPVRPADGVNVSWEAGWHLVGAAEGLSGFPGPVPATLSLAGEVELHAMNGCVAFTDASGAFHEECLGESSGGTHVDTPAARTYDVTRLVFRGRVQDAAWPLDGAWAMGAAGLSWRLDGDASWRRAAGSAEVDGALARFDDARVDATLAGVIAFDGAAPADQAPSGPVAYAAEGDLRAFHVDGARIGPAPRAAPEAAAPVALLSLGALLLLALTKGGQVLLAAGAASLYTRLSSDDLLRHPQRRRIHDAIHADPGIHQRELHRRVGGAWGPFAFHLRMLEKGGHLRLVSQGGYTCVFPTGVAPRVAIPHPLARAIHDAVPADGAPVLLADLAARLGVSRELAAYHVRNLEARGLLRRVDLPGPRKGVVRELPPRPAPDPAEGPREAAPDGTSA